jgi:hypothetical protein
MAGVFDKPLDLTYIVSHGIRSKGKPVHEAICKLLGVRIFPLLRGKDTLFRVYTIGGGPAALTTLRKREPDWKSLVVTHPYAGEPSYVRCG